MAKGEHPNSRANLKPPSTEEARERGAKGGKASARTRNNIKMFRNAIKSDIPPEKQDAILSALIDRAIEGDVKALELYCKITGQLDSTLDLKEQRAKIKQIEASTELTKAKKRQIEPEEQEQAVLGFADDDVVVIAMNGKVYCDTEHKRVELDDEGVYSYIDENGNKQFVKSKLMIRLDDDSTYEDYLLEKEAFEEYKDKTMHFYKHYLENRYNIDQYLREHGLDAPKKQE